MKPKNKTFLFDVYYRRWGGASRERIPLFRGEIASRASLWWQLLLEE